MSLTKFGSPEPIKPEDQHAKTAAKTVFNDEDRRALAEENAQTDQKEQ